MGKTFDLHFKLSGDLELPVVDVIASLSSRANEEDVSKRISSAATKYGLGALFGIAIIRSRYQKDADAVERLAQEAIHPLVFTITSNPRTRDAHDAFRELNPWRKGAKPSDSSLLKFLRELWSVEGFDEAIFLLYEELSPSSPTIPRYEMNVSEFLDWILRYYEIDTSQRKRGGAEGIFTVKKKLS